MVEFTTEFMSGTIYWAKVFKPVLNYNKDGKEWTFNLIIDDAGVDSLKKHRLLDRIKEANDKVPGDFLVLKKPELNKDGDRNDPIKVLTADGKPWDTQVNGLIGNGSKVDVRLTVADFGKGMKKAIWTSAIRVTDHIPNEGGTQDPFAGMDNDTPPVKAKAAAKAKPAPLSELDDDEIPF